MAPAILLVDDQRDILRLLHSALDTLRNPDLEILEAASGEAALQSIAGRRIDLLITDYNLPGINGMDLMHTARAAQPDLRVILITANSDRKVRDEMLNAGAVAVFSKPVPLGDFLAAVERGLGLARTILPAADEQGGAAVRVRLPELLANLRQDMHAEAALIISQRGLVAARAGDLRDSSMEVSLISALTAMFTSGLKVAESNRQDGLEQFSVFTGGDQELILMPIDASYSLLLAGRDFATGDRLHESVQAMRAVRDEMMRSLRELRAEKSAQTSAGKADESAGTAPEIEALLSSAAGAPPSGDDLDAFWDAAATQHAAKPMSKDVIPYDEARKLGLTPENDG